MILECPSSFVCVASVVNNFTVYTLEARVLIQSSSNLLRTLVLMMSWTLLKMGGKGSKSRSLDLFLEKSCYRSRGHNFDPIFIKLAQDVCLDDILDPIENGWDGVKK